jgi:hypothetical protein
MAELRPHHNNSGSVNIPWETAQDENLSFLARGVLLDALSRPPGWDFSIERMARSCKATVKGAGRDAVAAACRELEDAGYRRVGQTNGEGGRITRWVQFAFRPVPEWAAAAAANRAKRGGGVPGTRGPVNRGTASRNTAPPAETPGSTVNRDAVPRDARAVRETTTENNTHTGPGAANVPPDPWGDDNRVCVDIPEGGVRASVSWNVTADHIDAGRRIIEERTHPAALALLAEADVLTLAEKTGALLARGWPAQAVARAWPRTNEATFAPMRVIEPALDRLVRQDPPAQRAPRTGARANPNAVARLRARALDVAARFEDMHTDHGAAAAAGQAGLWRLTKWLHSADADALTAWLADPTPEVPDTPA